MVDVHSRRPQTQERLTQRIAGHLQRRLQPHGVGVVIEAEHTCMRLPRRVPRPHQEHAVNVAVRGPRISGSATSWPARYGVADEAARHMTNVPSRAPACQEVFRPPVSVEVDDVDARARRLAGRDLGLVGNAPGRR